MKLWAWCRLGWLPGTAAIGILTALTAYSGFLISRLVHAVSGAILFGDIGEAAAGPKVGTRTSPCAHCHALQSTGPATAGSSAAIVHGTLAFVCPNDARMCRSDVARSVQGRTLVYAIVYSLGATRCIILHLATSESLQHAMGGEDGSLMLCGLTVALVSLALVQVTYSAFSGASPGAAPPPLQQQQYGKSLRHAWAGRALALC